eukprot:1732963-Amphidinium_carterae.1
MRAASICSETPRQKCCDLIVQSHHGLRSSLALNAWDGWSADCSRAISIVGARAVMQCKTFARSSGSTAHGGTAQQ